VFDLSVVAIALVPASGLFIGVIVSAMQSFTDADKAETIAAVEEAREHIEADLHSEVRALRSEIAELRVLLRQPRPYSN
jgi:voltage-gated sodium channel